MENGRIKEKKNRQEFEHNLPGPTPDPPPEVETDIALDSMLYQSMSMMKRSNTYRQKAKPTGWRESLLAQVIAICQNRAISKHMQLEGVSWEKIVKKLKKGAKAGAAAGAFGGASGAAVGAKFGSAFGAS